MDGSLPGSSVYGIFQARVLDWVAISFSRGSSRPRGQTQVSHVVSRHFTAWATVEVWATGKTLPISLDSSKYIKQDNACKDSSIILCTWQELNKIVSQL